MRLVWHLCEDTMLLVLLFASVALLSTTQAQEAGLVFAICIGKDNECDVGEWAEWGSCGGFASSCRGHHVRLRKLCCDPDLDVYQCLSKCHRTVDQHIESEPCDPKCVYGTSNGSGCTCEDQSYGECCRYSTLKCSDHPCTHHATCVDSDSGYKCICQSGWTGHKCSITVPSMKTIAPWIHDPLSDAPTYKPYHPTAGAVVVIFIVVPVAVIVFAIVMAASRSGRNNAAVAVNQEDATPAPPDDNDSDDHHLITIS